MGLSDNGRYADVKGGITAIIQSISSYAVEFLLCRTPQHRESGEGIKVLRADACEPGRHRGVCRGVAKLNLQRGQAQPRVGLNQLAVKHFPIRLDRSWL